MIRALRTQCEDLLADLDLRILGQQEVLTDTGIRMSCSVEETVVQSVLDDLVSESVHSRAVIGKEVYPDPMFILKYGGVLVRGKQYAIDIGVVMVLQRGLLILELEPMMFTLPNCQGVPRKVLTKEDAESALRKIEGYNKVGTM